MFEGVEVLEFFGEEEVCFVEDEDGGYGVCFG